mmetsp:Transcript_3823/g.12349  ORF Transcript_3823/g.12349 Transcript_3823/m.12349 type:complete len:211 (-) Transcript_3823:887-1519(-)
MKNACGTGSNGGRRTLPFGPSTPRRDSSPHGHARLLLPVNGYRRWTRLPTRYSTMRIALASSSCRRLTREPAFRTARCTCGPAWPRTRRPSPRWPTAAPSSSNLACFPGGQATCASNERPDVPPKLSSPRGRPSTCWATTSTRRLARTRSRTLASATPSTPFTSTCSRRQFSLTTINCGTGTRCWRTRPKSTSAVPRGTTWRCTWTSRAP